MMSRTGGRRRADEFQQLKRRTEVAKFYLQGYRQHEIAVMMKISANTVMKDLGLIREEWLEQILRDFDQKQAEELAKLDRLEQEAWDSFIRSKEEGEVIRDRTESVRQTLKRQPGRPKKGTPQSQPSAHKLVPIKHIREVVKKGQTGDPRFLDLIERIVTTRLKLLGLLKADTGTTNVVNLNWGDLVAQQQGQPQMSEVRYLEAEPPPSLTNGSDHTPHTPTPPLHADPIEARILAAGAGVDRNKTRPLGLPQPSENGEDTPQTTNEEEE